MRQVFNDGLYVSAHSTSEEEGNPQYHWKALGEQVGWERISGMAFDQDGFACTDRFPMSGPYNVHRF